MKTKLIKLSDIHYIVVDDSEIIENTNTFIEGINGDWFYNTKFKFIARIGDITLYDFKVTHSTQPLESTKTFSEDTNVQKISWGSIKPLSLSEVEEAVNGYSVEKMAEKKFPYPIDIKDKNDKIIQTIGKKPYNHAKVEKYRRIWIQGFNAHQELVKDKVFTVDDMKKAIDIASGERLIDKELQTNLIIQSLLPKTEWGVEVDEQGKLKLI